MSKVDNQNNVLPKEVIDQVVSIGFWLGKRMKNRSQKLKSFENCRLQKQRALKLFV